MIRRRIYCAERYYIYSMAEQVDASKQSKRLGIVTLLSHQR